MILKELKIYNFRCFAFKKNTFCEGINIFFGLNAVGKTSLLESINYLCLTKSFKTSNESEVIKMNETDFMVSGVAESRGVCNQYKVVKTKKGKKVFKNQYKFVKISEYLGQLLVVSFSNYDLIKLVTSSKERRKIFEPIICQLFLEYVSASNTYNKILNNRNALLKKMKIEENNKYIEIMKILDFQLCQNAEIIINTRKRFIDIVNNVLTKIHQQIASVDECFVIKYKPSVFAFEIQQKLKLNFEYDLVRGTTCVGPHKDDFVFEINDKNIIEFCSQGQQRNALISLKIAFAKILRELKNESPILLLDDVCSELDSIRQNNLMKILNDDMQVFISTATLAEIDESIKKNANIILLEKEEK